MSMGLDEVDPGRLPRLLAELEQQWRRNDAPIVGALVPGLSAAEAQRIAASAGLTLPTQALIWFGWHNGTTAPANQHRTDSQLGGGFYLMSLAESIAARQGWQAGSMSVAEDSDLPAPEYYWDPSWLPIATTMHAAVVVIDCATRDNELTPVLVIEWENTAFRKPAAPSLTAAVSLWVELLRRGTWRFSNETGRWETVGYMELEPRIKASFLA